MIPDRYDNGSARGRRRRRRELLVAAGSLATLGVAGCIDGGGDGSTGDGSGDLTISDLGLTDSGRFRGNADGRMVEFEVENQGNQATGRVTVTVDWLDDNGDQIGEPDTGTLVSLGAGETWHSFLDPNSDLDTRSYDLSVEAESGPPENPENIEVSDHELDIGQANANITGTVDFSDREDLGDRDRLSVIAKLYNNDGTVIDSTSNYDPTIGSTTFGSMSFEISLGNANQLVVGWYDDNLGDYELFLELNQIG